MKKWFKFLASLKLAVFVIVCLATLIAVGTFVEAEYDAKTAAQMVYKTKYMYGIMMLLCTNLIAVMVDRWPWKRRHLSFLLAHIGIITLLVGSWITAEYGLDGSMRFGIGESSRLVTIDKTDVNIYASFDGDRFSKIYEKEVDFYKNNPKDKPLNITLSDGEDLAVIDFMPFATVNKHIAASENTKLGSAVRFQMSNDRVNTSEWLLQKKIGETAKSAMGLAEFFLGEPPKIEEKRNSLYFTPAGAQLKWTLDYKDPARHRKTGIVNEGESFSTGWMGLEVKILRYIPLAEEIWDFKESKRPNANTTPAIKLKFLGKEYWTQVDDVIKLFSDQAVYILAYAHRRIDLGFPITLKRFDMGKYPGTNQAMSYQSLIETKDAGEVLISMNEPHKEAGYTFYQASFQEGPSGQPEASILSVNQDPGRALKYLGSLILTLGVVYLFYDRRKSARAAVEQRGLLK